MLLSESKQQWHLLNGEHPVIESKQHLVEVIEGRKIEEEIK